MADSAQQSDQPHGLSATIEAHAVHAGDHHGEVNPMEVSGGMVIWTWVLFAVTLFALYKLAWKPILGALDKREDEIQAAMDNAAKLREEMDNLEQVRAEKIAEADAKSRQILDTAKRGAQEQAGVIVGQAEDKARILSENARREIDISRALAEDTLRVKSAAWARALAGQLIEENLDDEKNRALTDKLIEEL